MPGIPEWGPLGRIFSFMKKAWRGKREELAGEERVTLLRNEKSGCGRCFVPDE